VILVSPNFFVCTFQARGGRAHAVNIATVVQALVPALVRKLTIVHVYAEPIISEQTRE